MDWQDRYWVTSDGVSIHYRDYAADQLGQTIICLPGLSRNCRDFEHLALRLFRRARVIAPSLRGRGLSDYARDRATYVPDIYVDDLIGLLRELRQERVIVIGTSLGARLAMLMAARAPGLIAASVLNDLGPETPAAALALVKSSLAGRQRHWPDQATAIAAIAQANAAAYPDFDAAAWASFAGNLLREDVDGSVSLDFDPAISSTYQEVPPPPAGLMWAGFDELSKAPVLSIRGALSAMLSAGVQEMMRSRASARFDALTVPRVGHAPTLSEPIAIAAIESVLS